jgi:putative DNA primase/helicase
VIPSELRERPQWVVWRYEERDDKRTKVPYRADGQGRASSTDPSTWASYDAAVAASDTSDGIGFVFSADDPFVGIDLDHGLSEADRGAILCALDSYAERSVSGTGYHVFIRASLNGHPRNRKGPIEIYEHGRYFVVTGDHIIGTPATIEDRQAELEEVLARFLPTPPAQLSTRPIVPVDLDDRELLERAMQAKNGADFECLWAGDTSEYDDDDSRADFALCRLLAFWTNRDADRIDRLFRASGLYREKWERADYRERTIETAIAATSEGYEPLTQTQKSVESVKVSQEGTERDGLTDSPLTESVKSESVPSRDSDDAATDSDPESVAVPSRPFALPIREFIELEREQREPLLASADGRAVVGRHSLTLLGALGGHGKTTWFVDLALHLAAGVDYEPFTVPGPVSILIVENEGPEELFAEKLAGRLATFRHELKARLDVCTVDWGGFSLAHEGLRGRLKYEIGTKGYDLVFGDPLDSLGIAGVGSPEDTRAFLALMKETGLNKAVAWWLNTHPRKEETKEALNEISGSWGGKPDTVFLLRMLDDDRTQIRQPKLRWARRGKGPTLLFAFDPDTEAFSFIGEESEEERDYLAEISGLLGDGRWRTAKEIAAPKKKGGTGANVDTIKQVLEEHPDVFESRTGEAAKELGRSARATVWQLLEGEE